MKRESFLLFPLVFVGLLMAPLVRAADTPADMVIYNGKILTVDSPDPNSYSTGQAAAIANGRFIAI